MLRIHTIDSKTIDINADFDELRKELLMASSQGSFIFMYVTDKDEIDNKIAINLPNVSFIEEIEKENEENGNI